MSLSSFCVVTNALRLNFVRLANTSKTDANPPQIIMNIKGMMCEHCENTVKKALLSVEGVSLAEANHKKNIAYVWTSGDVDIDSLKAVVEAEDYKVKKKER